MSSDNELDVNENFNTNNATNKSLIQSVVSKVKRLLPWFGEEDSTDGARDGGPRLKRPRLESSPIPGRSATPLPQLPANQEEPSFIVPSTPHHNFTFSTISSPPLVFNTRQNLLPPSQPSPPPAPPLNGDDQSENSDGSTSGCSSLYPQGPGKKVELSRRDASVGTDTSSVSSAFADITSSLRRKPLWSETRRPQPSPVPSNRPSFNYSLLGPSHIPTKPSRSSTVDKKYSSPYYDGATCFGGSSAKKKPFAPSVAQPYTRPVQVRINTPKKDSMEYLSVTARKILKSMETSSLKINDPVETPTAPAPLTFNTQKYKKNLVATSSQNVSGPPVASSPHPNPPPTRTAYYLEPILTPKKKPEPKEKPTPPPPEATKVAQQPAARQPDRPKPPVRSDGGGKIKSKLSQSQHTSAVRLPQEDLVEQIPLPNIALPPISSLPKFSFSSSSSSKVPAATAQQPSTDTSVKFTFSSPIHQHPAPLVSPQGTQPTPTFNFSQPLKVVDSPPKEDIKKTPPPPPTSDNQSRGSRIKAAPTYGWVCSVCLIVNKAADTVCLACTTPKPGAVAKPTPPPEDKPNITPPPNTSEGWGDRFKAPPNTWSCPVCLITNKASDGACLACTTPKPGSSAAATSSKETSASTAACSSCGGSLPGAGKECPTCSKPKGFGDKFKPAPGIWTCDTCLVQNKPSESKCVACETRRPGSMDLFNDKASKPLFKFGLDSAASSGDATSFKFGVPTTTVSQSPPAPTFNFGIPASQQSTSHFKYGIPTSSTVVSQSSTSITSTLNFGVPTSSTAVSKPTSTVSADFNFGIPTSSTAVSQPTSTVSAEFKFGIPTSSTAVSQSTASSFKLGTESPMSSKEQTFKFGTPIATNGPQSGVGDSTLPTTSVFGVVSSSTTASKQLVPNNKHVTFEEAQSTQASKPQPGLADMSSREEVPLEKRPLFSFFSKESAQPPVTKSVMFEEKASNAVSSSEPKKKVLLDSLQANSSSPFKFGGAPEAAFKSSPHPTDKENGPQPEVPSTQPAPKFGLSPLKEHPVSLLPDSNQQPSFNFEASQKDEMKKEDNKSLFRFGQTEASQPLPAAAPFAFGTTTPAPTSTCASSGGMFNFGASSTAGSTASMFNFGGSGGGGFSFGATTTTTAAAPTSSSGAFSFSTPASTSPFSFGMAGSSAPSTATTPFKFGASNSSPAPQFGASADPFKFGTPAAQPPTAAATAPVFKFGESSTNQAFAFGAQQPQAGGYNFGSYVGGANPTPAINFVSATPSPVARPPAFGQPAVNQNSLTPAAGTTFPGQFQAAASGLQDGGLNRPARRIKKAQRKVTRAT